MAHELPTTDRKFVRKLQQFAADGYKFDSAHALRKGTAQSPKAKGTQREAFDAFVTGLKDGHRQGYYEIPTGVGKTALFISLIKNYLDAVDGDKDAPRVLITVPSNDLVIQTAKAFAKFMPDLAKTIETDDEEGKEIDWENSDIGVQYSRKKHAHKKPKVLITTYQSLAKDADREPADRIYPPEEYGFVVFDEGHNTTADKFGRAVGRFENAIELAVTATPEYSEEKTVAQQLPHCHYRLPLHEAINRGDLCPVDPILIKTNYHVDEKKLRAYMEKQNGRNLTQKQMEDLLNQESRNLAAIKTYLLGSDPHTGERYFGQTGMIFAGGIQHCEDFSRQVQKVLGTPKYREMREWLKAEGIAPVAYLHSKFPKEGIPLIIDGQKRNYTRDQIKALHRRGKILLLVSDKELKEGTDFPRDSIVMDLVDRLSKLDATQRLGRGARRNPADPDYDDPGDPEKRCKAFNLVDENTWDLYKDTPQMLPIYAGEILDVEGAQFREPMKRKHMIHRFNNTIPDAPETLQQAGFDVITNIDRVKEVSAKYKKRKKELELPEKTEDDLTLGTELPQALNIKARNPKFSDWHQGVKTKLEANEKVEVGGYPIQKMMSGRMPVYCLSRNALPTLARQLGINFTTKALPMKTEDDLTLGDDLQRALGVSRKNSKFADWYQEVTTKLEAGKKVKIGKYPIRQMQSGPKKPYCFPRAALPILAQKLDIELVVGTLPIKTENDLTLSAELPSALGISEANLSFASWYQEVKTKLAAGEKVKIGKYPIRQMQSGPKKPYCFPRAALPILAQQLDIELVVGILPIKTENDLTLSTDLPRELGIALKNTAFHEWRTRTEEQLKSGQKVKVGDYHVIKMRCGQGKASCIPRDAMESLRVELGLTKEAESGDKTKRTQTISPKSIKPGSPDLARTGRGRGRDGE